MDFDAILHYSLYITLLVGLPVIAGLVYFVLLLHQAIRNDERFSELKKRRGRREERLRRLEEARRLADPFFHFNISEAPGIDEIIQEKLARERGTVFITAEEQKLKEREKKIQQAIEKGRLILMDTELSKCSPGMVLGRGVEQLGMSRGDELTAQNITRFQEAGYSMLPILYNPGRVANAIEQANASAPAA